MAMGAKPWSKLLLPAATLLVLAVILTAAKPAAAGAAPDGTSCSKDHLPPQCGANVLSTCRGNNDEPPSPPPSSIIGKIVAFIHGRSPTTTKTATVTSPNCGSSWEDQVKAKACCDALEAMSQHQCATCALLKEFDAVKNFDPAKCESRVAGPAKECKEICKNPSDARCKFQ